MVHTDKEIRDAAREASVNLRKFSVDTFSTNVDLYKAFKGYVNGNAKAEKLSKIQQYFLDEEIDDFIRGGLDLPEEKLKEARALKKEISEVGTEFDANIAQDNRSITVSCNELAGLSDDFITALKKDDKDNYILGIDYPTYFEVMKHCSVEQTRKRLWLEFNNRAYPKNIKVLEKLIELRDKLAHKLGFESYAHLATDDKMAKNPDTVKDFLNELIPKVTKKADKEFKGLFDDLPHDVSLTEDGKIDPWNYNYVIASYKKKHFNLDPRVVAEYFPMEKTIDAVFDIYQQFFNVRFVITKPENMWHEDVQLIEVYRKEDDVPQGYIFLDLYPRSNKYSHACHETCVSGVNYNGNKTPSVAVLIANFPKSTEDKPSLLKHDDVVTFFHEFGHAMHGVLGQTELASFSGTATKRDFVEMPSQMFEEWMWDKEMLKRVTSHYQTGESLPDNLIDTMLELKRFDSGYFVLRQCAFAFLSLHCYENGERKDTNKLVRDMYAKYFSFIRFEPQGHFQASFGHLNGYSAYYYSYMWSKVFALDMFDYIKKQGLLNPEVGEKLINDVLGRGGSADPNELIVEFLGRKPKQDAFLKDIGI
jgi:thimet oligopeptidase